MARRKAFNVHDLYPADYCFDWDSFEADPEHYVFTQDDIAYSNAMELEKYEQETPMTPYEERALRRWVASGHSVMEPPPSKYGCIYPAHPAPDFLEVYRTDKELDAATRGMTTAEKITYLKKYIGYEDEPEDERLRREENERLHEQTPEDALKVIRKLQREIFYLYMFRAEQGMASEVNEYMEEHMNTPIPFEDEW